MMITVKKTKKMKKNNKKITFSKVVEAKLTLI